MKFLDKKEEVLDTVLTPYGEYLLSIGRLKPEYYAFFDDNVLYESQYGRPNESPEREQNSIEPRIQEETPQLATQVVFSDRNVFHNTGLLTPTLGITGPLTPPAGAGPTKAVSAGAEPVVPVELALPAELQQSIEKLKSLSDTSAFDRDYYGPQYALGTTDKLTTKAPAWSVTLLRGEIASSTDTFTSSTRPTLDIPQINVDLVYKIDTIANRDFISDTELAMEFENGEFLDIDPEILLCQIKELNSEFTKDNFEIEVFEVTTEGVAGLESSVVERLRPLKFRRRPSNIQNGILLDDDEIVSTNEPVTPENVEYYFNIYVDSQINSQLICSSIEENKKDGRYINVDFECEDVKNIALVDIYSTDAASEPCPDLDDPCSDKPGTIY